MTLPCRSFERRRGSRPSSGGFRRARLFFLRRRGTIAARKQGGTAMEKQPQLHTIAPVYDENSRILILGSFPSVKSREAAFFYGHPQNRFWRVLAAVLGEEAPQTAGGKEVPAPASWRRAVGRHRLLRHRRLVRREHHECGAKRPLAPSGRRAGPPHLLQRRHGLPLLPAWYDEAVWGKAGGSALHQSRQRALVRAGAHGALARGARAMALTAPRR